MVDTSDRPARVAEWVRHRRLPVRIWRPKPPVCGAGMNACAWSGRFSAHFLGSAEMKFRLIADQRETFPVLVMCDVMGVYVWAGRPATSFETK
jgi:hypothetical protein